MKQIKLSLLFFSLITHAALAQIPTKGMVGYWPMDAHAKDMSGNANHGVQNGVSVASDRFGNDSSAYYFDGGSDYIRVKASKSLNLSGSFTVAAWINPETFGEDPTQGFGRIIDKGKYRFFLNNADNGTYTYHSLVTSIDTGSNTFPWASDQYSITLRNWQHVAVVITLDGNNNKCDFYVNGGVVYTYYTTALPTVFDNGANDDLFIGERYALDRAFQGSIDELYIYNRSLSAAEVNMLFRDNMHKTIIDTTHVYDTTYVTDTVHLNVTDTLYIKLNSVAVKDKINFKNIIKVYPNPTHDHISIDFGTNFNTLNKYTIKIMNSAAVKVYETGIQKQTEYIDLNAFSGKGTYFVQLLDENKKVVSVKQIVLQ